MENEEKSLSTMSNMDLMSTIANDTHNSTDVKLLTSDQVQDQLKIFLIAQARNELMRVVKLTQFLDKLENSFISEVTNSLSNNELTLKQYNEVISVIVALLNRSNEIISKVLKDDSLTMILTKTYDSNSTSSESQVSVVSSLKNPQSRERVRSVINNILFKAEQYSYNNSEVKEEGNING